MKIITTAIISGLVVFSLSAQVPVHKDIMKIFGKIPPPPASVKDAFIKGTVENEGGITKYSAMNLFKSVDNEIKGILDEFAAQPKPDASSVVPGVSPETVKKMSDPEMQKKMKKMSKEEKMKMAMEMMDSMTPGTSAIEQDPPPIRAALNEWQLIYNNTQNDFLKMTSDVQENAKKEQEYENTQSEIEKWETGAITALPQISSGEMSAPDPVKVKEVKLKASDRHIAAANKHLEQINSKWKESFNQAKNKYSVFYQKLIEANYAADSKNYSTQKILADAQLSIMQVLQRQVEESRKAYEESASWQAKQNDIQNNKLY